MLVESWVGPMASAWQIYDELIEGIPAIERVTAVAIGPQWCRVASTGGGMGMAFAFSGDSRPQTWGRGTFVDAPLRDVAKLAKSWNTVEAGIGVAAINSWYGRPEVAKENGFQPSAENAWNRLFHPYSEAVAGKVVTVVGHFPFAEEPLSLASELHVLERNPQPGDHSDAACEYLIPESDVVFISGSAFVNRTIPRLLELARDARTIVVGPSTPLSTRLFEHGADVVTGFVASSADELFDCLGEPMNATMYHHAHRVEQAALDQASVA